MATSLVDTPMAYGAAAPALEAAPAPVDSMLPETEAIDAAAPFQPHGTCGSILPSAVVVIEERERRGERGEERGQQGRKTIQCAQRRPTSSVRHTPHPAATYPYVVSRVGAAVRTWWVARCVAPNGVA